MLLQWAPSRICILLLTSVTIISRNYCKKNFAPGAKLVLSIVHMNCQWVQKKINTEILLLQNFGHCYCSTTNIKLNHFYNKKWFTILIHISFIHNNNFKVSSVISTHGLSMSTKEKNQYRNITATKFWPLLL